MNTLRTPLLAALCALALPPAAALSQGFPVTVTDDRGAAVTLQEAPEHIAALSIFASDMLEYLDMTETGAITYEGRFPAFLTIGADVTDYGDMTSPNLELMTEDGIDLSIGMVNYAGPFSEELEAIGAFLAYDGVTLDDSYRNVENLATALGRPEAGIAANEEFRALLDDLSARAPGGVSALFVWSFYDTLYGYQDNLLPSEFLPLLGATNVLGHAEGGDPIQAFVPLELEDLLTLDPDVFFLFVSHGEEPRDVPVYERMRAVTEGRAHLVSDHYSQSTGPIARGMVLREIAHLLYPDTFEAPELPEGVAARPLRP